MNMPEGSEFGRPAFFGYLNTETDHMILHRQWTLMPSIAQKLNIGVDDALFITGLFANYTRGHK